MRKYKYKNVDYVEHKVIAEVEDSCDGCAFCDDESACIESDLCFDRIGEIYNFIIWVKE